MAKQSKAPTPVMAMDTEEEMTVIVVRVKGSGSTLQKGLDAIGNAFASLSPTPTVPSGATRRVINGVPKQLPPAETSEESSAEDEDDDTGDEQQEEAQNSNISSPKRGPRKYKFMDDLDLSQGDQPWKEFATERGGKNDNDHYLLAALWLTENASLPEFGMAHVFTCFRAMGWSEQVDFSQPMRSMKSKKSYFSHPSKKLWKLTGPGLDAAKAVSKGDAK